MKLNKLLLSLLLICLLYVSFGSAVHEIKCPSLGSDCELLTGNNLTTEAYEITYGYQGGERRTCGNTFTLTETKTIYGISADTDRVNNPNGTMAVILEDTGAPYQTPGNMACGNNVTGQGLNGTSSMPVDPGWNNVSFNAPCELTPGSYFLVLYAANKTVDGNSYSAKWHSSSAYAGGNIITGRYGVIQSPNANRDMGFYIWGADTAVVDTTPPEITTSTLNHTTGRDAPNQTAWADFGKLTMSETTDSTITITFTATETSNFSIGLSDKNLTDMVPDYGNDCATTDTTIHSCTVNSTFAASLGSQCFYLSGRDTSGNENVTSTSGCLNVSLIDLTNPTFSNAVNTSSNSFRRYSNLTANITISDALAGLDFYIFSSNASGSWVNYSAVDISGTSYAASNNTNITQTKGQEVCWYYWANDTSGNSAKSSNYCFDVANSPPAITLNAPVNNTTVPDTTYALLNVTPTDLEGDEMNVSFYSGATEECYQETANESTSCGGLATGAYQNDSAFNIWSDCIKSVYDGDWNTSCNGAEGRLFINYTKPTDATDAIWQVKDENGTYNLTVPDDCWNQYPDKLSFRIRSKANLADWRCWNSTDINDWLLLRYNDSVGAGNIYEEAMYWNISVIGTADNISSGDNATYNWTGLTLNTTYTWYTTATDGIDTTTSDTWTFHTLGDTTYPYWSNNGTNATSNTKTGANVYFNVTLTDEYAGGNQIFSYYNGSSWLNDSLTSWSTPADLKEERTLTATRGMNISWYWWFDDSYSNINQTDTWSFVVNNTIPIASSVNITSSDSLNRTNGTLTGSWVYSDVDSDPETDNETQWYKNTEEQIDLQNFTSVDHNNLTKGESWIFSVRVYDDYDWSIWTNSSTFTVENTAPNITLNSPANGSVNQSLTTTLNVSVTDLDDDNINVTFYQNDTTLLGSIILRDNLVNTLSDGNSSKVLTFTQADNQTFYITISDYANMTSSADNLTGLVFAYVTEYSWQTLTQSDFNEGTYNQTFYNTSGFVQLNATNVTGNYTSKILNALVDSEWNNISWISNAIGELPANQIIETEFGNGNANMTGNVLLMHFNNDSTYGENDALVYDFSGEGNNGTVTSATWTTAGKLGAGAFNYDGVNDFVSVPDTDDLDLQSDFTMMAWFKTNIDDQNQVLISKGYTLYGNYLLMKHESNAIRFFASADGSSWGTDITGPTINNDIWYHVAITHNGSTTQLYLNGTYKAQDTTPVTPAISSDPLNIGRRGFFLLNYFNGTIDEVAIYNRSLSAGEILDHYKRGILELNLTVRSCDDASCTSDAWNETYTTSPQNLSVDNNTYFQYKFDFETENVAYSPELYNVTVDYKKGYNYPENVTLNIGNDSVSEWNQSGIFNYTTTVNDSNTAPVFSSKLNSILTDCSCSGCVHDTTAETCKIPFVLSSETPGKINVSDINITYDYDEDYFSSYIWRGLIPNTTYGWFVSASDGTDETNSSVWYFTTWVGPEVTLNAPVNGYHINISETITFNCTVRTECPLTNVSLYLTDSSNSSFALNETNSTFDSIYLTDVIFTKNISEGDYTWNCRACDSDDHCLFAPANFSFTSGYIGLRLDGVDANRSYEYRTTANITTGANYINIYDDTGRYRNELSPFSYLIDLLRQNKFNDSTTWKNISEDKVICFQETANISTSCGGLSSGSYGRSGNFYNGVQQYERCFDGLYNTACSGFPNDEDGADFYVNYSKPTGSSSSSLWQIKGLEGGAAMWLNLSIPYNCWAQNVLQFKIHTAIGAPPSIDGLDMYCMNNIGWYLLFSNNRTDSSFDGNLYEEAMYWILNNFTTSVELGSKDELYNATLNITGINNPENVTLTYFDDYNLFFPGILKERELYQPKIIVSNVLYNIHNISFDSAESKTIYIDYSNQGDVLNRDGSLNFTITGFNLDINNEFIYNDNFTNVTVSGGTYGDNVSLLTEIDDFGDNDSSKWTMTNGPMGGEMSIVNKDYLRLYQERTGAGTFEVDWIYNDEDFDMRTLNKFETNLSFIQELACDRAYEDTTFLNIIYLTDGTTDIQLWGRHNWIDCQDYEIADVYKENIDLRVIKSTKGKINVYTDDTTFEADISTLDDNQRQYLKFYSSITIQLGMVRAVTEYKLYNLSVGGISLKNNNSTFPINAYYNYTSDSLNITPTDIKRATLNATVYNPDNTTINYYLSNDNGTTWEEVSNGVTHSMTSDGKNISATFEIKSTNNTSSPRIFDYSVSVIATELSSLIIDVGDDGITNANYSVLNATTTPTYYIGNDSSANLYINRSCNETDCLIPIVFLSGSGGTIQISNFNLTQDICPLTLNVTYIGGNVINLTSTGHVNLTDLKFDYYGEKNITINAETDGSDINRTMSVFYSPFDVTIIPAGIDYWDINPNIYAYVQNDIAPFGNADGDGNPFFLLNLTTWAHPTDVYIRYNESVNTCQVTTFEGYNFSDSAGLNQTLNATGQILIENISSLNQNWNISTLTNISCAAYNDTLIIPYFCFHSLCTECVKTSDYDDDCSLIE